MRPFSGVLRKRIINSTGKKPQFSFSYFSPIKGSCFQPFLKTLNTGFHDARSRQTSVSFFPLFAPLSSKEGTLLLLPRTSTKFEGHSPQHLMT